MDPNLLRVTQHIVERSQQARKTYLACGNLTHSFAACQLEYKASLKRKNVAQ